MAANSCGDTKTCQIGPTASDIVFAMNLADVSTLVPTNPGDNAERAHRTQLTLNDLGTDCPQTADATYTGPQNWGDAVKEFSSYTKNEFNRCNPRLAIPMAIKQYGYPYWKHCNIWGNEFGWFDPPGAVPTVTGGYLPDPATATTTTGSEPEETSVEAFPSAAKSMPSATKDPTTGVSTDDRSTRATPTASAPDAQERPQPDTDIAAAAEDHPTSTSPSPPKDQGKQASDDIAKSKAADAVVSGFKSGVAGSVTPASSVKRPSGDTNPTASANTGAHQNDGDSEDQVSTKGHDEESDTSKAGALKDDSDPHDQAATKADDDEPDTSNEASHKEDNDPKDQTAAKGQDDDSNPSNSAAHKDGSDPKDQTVKNSQDEKSDPTSSAAHKDDSDTKDQAATQAQNDDEPDTSNSAARVVAGIFNGIAQDDQPGSAETNPPDDTHNAAGHSIDSSETSDFPTADEEEDPSGRPNVKSPEDTSQSIAKTDGDDGEPAAQGESSPDEISASPALGGPTHAAADGSAYHPSEETDTVPKWTTVNGHVVSASGRAQHTVSANTDLQGDSRANGIGGPDDPEMVSSSTAAGNRDQADRVAGPLNDESASSSNTSSDSDSDSAEFGSTESPTKDDGDVTTTPVESDGAAIDPDGSASAEESPGGAVATGTESLPSSTMLSNSGSLSSANAQASTAPISKDENGGSRPGVAVGSGYLFATLYAMVLYHL
jgi:hypothetical protein